MNHNTIKPVIVLLHGFCENSSLWDHIIPKLEYSGQIIALNLPGFGGEPLHFENFSLADIANKIYTDLTNKGVDNCICIGHSLGGYISLALKKLHPTFVVKVGLIHSSAYADTLEKKKNRNKLINLLNNQSTTTFLSSFIPSLFCEINIEALKSEINKVIKMSDGLEIKTIQAYSKAMRDREDNSNILSNEKSLLFIAGECDNSVPIEISKKQINIIKDKSNSFLLKNVAHMGMYESPSIVIKAINQYIT